MSISRDKYIEVHERAQAEEINTIGLKFLTHVNEYLDDVKKRLNHNEIGTPEDAVECELTNNWYKSLVPFISQLQLNTAPSLQNVFKDGFNVAAKPQYTEDDFIALQMAQESGSNKVYTSIMATAERIHEGLAAKALDKANALGDKRDEAEGAPDVHYRREVSERFLARVDDLLLELHDMVMPDLSDGPSGNGQNRKGPPSGPKGPRF